MADTREGWVPGGGADVNPEGGGGMDLSKPQSWWADYVKTVDKNDPKSVGVYLSASGAQNADEAQKALAELYGGADKIPDSSFLAQAEQARQTNANRMSKESGGSTRDVLGAAVIIAGFMVGAGAVSGAAGGASLADAGASFSAGGATDASSAFGGYEATDSTLATQVLNGSENSLETALQSGTVDGPSLVEDQAVQLGGAPVADTTAATLPQATTAPAVTAAPEVTAPQLGTYGAEAAGGAVAPTVSSTAPEPWYKGILDWASKNPVPASIGAQGILGAVGAIGAASAKEKETDVLKNAPFVKQQADAASMAGAGQSQHITPTGNMMPPAWNNAGTATVVPKDPITGLPLGPKYPQTGLINNAVGRT